MSQAPERPEPEHQLRTAVAGIVPYSDSVLVRLVLRHPARTLAAAGTFVVVFKLLVAANWNTTVALALASTGNPPTLLLGVLIASVPALLPLLLGAAWGAVIGRRQTKGSIEGPVMAFALVVIFTFVLAPARYALFLLGLLVLRALAEPVIRWVESRVERPSEPDGRKPLWTADPLAVLILATLSVYLLSVPPVWLPAEVVTFGTQPTTGYVMGVADGWVSFLTDEDRSLEYHPLVEMTSRVICERVADDPTVLELLGRGASLPVCP